MTTRTHDPFLSGEATPGWLPQGYHVLGVPAAAWGLSVAGCLLPRAVRPQSCRLGEAWCYDRGGVSRSDEYDLMIDT